MRLLDYQLSKGSNGTVRVEASWADRMRRPARVRIEAATGNHIPEGNKVLVDIDESELLGLLSGFGEIAWEMGWRPAGLVETMANVVKNFKPVKP